MPTVERLVEILAGEYRWGLHPLKVCVALLVPTLIVWLADRRLRARADVIQREEEQVRRLPRTRRR